MSGYHKFYNIFKKSIIAFFVISFVFLLSACPSSPVYLTEYIYIDSNDSNENQISNNDEAIPAFSQSDEVYIDFYFRGGTRMYDFIDGANNPSDASNPIYIKTLSNCFNAHIDISEWNSVTFSYYKYIPDGLYQYKDESFFKRTYDKKRFYTTGFDEKYNFQNNIYRTRQWRITQEDSMNGKTVTDLGLPPVTNCALQNLVDEIEKINTENHMSVITSYFYEDKGDYKPITELYANAFKHGLGGSIFCIESDYFGENMPQAEPGSIWERIILPDGGIKFNFFIMVVGPAEQVRAYSDSLSRALIKDGISDFYSSYFLPFNSKTKGYIEFPDNLKYSDIMHIVNPVYEIKQNINNDEFITSSINAGLIKTNGKPESRVKNKIKLKEYIIEEIEEPEGGQAPAAAANKPRKFNIKDADVLSFKPLAKSTRYIIGIPVSERSQANSFEYSDNFKDAKLNIYNSKDEAFGPYPKDFSGIIDIKLIKREHENYSEFETYSKENHKRISEDANLIYIEIFIEKNSDLPKENMRLDIPIKYDLDKIPEWVENKSVSTVDDLNNYINEKKEIKNLNLLTAYIGIVTELGRHINETDKEIYSLPVYIINN